MLGLYIIHVSKMGQLDVKDLPVSYMIQIVAANHLAMYGARASAAIVLS